MNSIGKQGSDKIGSLCNFKNNITVYGISS